MNFKALLEGIPYRWAGPAADAAVQGICTDSRRVRAGDLFVALKGQKQDGHDHAEAVVRAGAAAVLAERPLPLSVPVAVVPSTLEALSPVAARFYGHPSRALNVVGVTGTNGKTTVTYLLESIFREAGFPPGVMGTVEYRWADRKESAPNTTPLSADVQRLLARMRDEGVTHVAMEVSSHALSLRRVEDVSFAAAVFTNLTRDHLDFHKDMESYFEAKARLFDLLADSPPGSTGVRRRCAIINQDDAWSEKLLARLRIEALTYGLGPSAQLTASDLSLTADKTEFLLRTPQGSFPCRIGLVGRHNVYNALAAGGAALALNVPLEAVRKGLEALKGVPGRLEKVEGARPLPFSVFVDYAHTDDALKNVLGALRPLTRGRLITVFGCGGDRDRTKRPLMGEAAVKLSDRVIVTSDNPRSEDPARIALDIEVGIRRTGASHYEIVMDRAEAIARALKSARPGDVVLLAGKGHETYQIFKDRTVHFDDRETARALLSEMG